MNSAVIASTRFQNLNDESNNLVVKRGNLLLDLSWALKLLKKTLHLGVNLN